jgi:hypothetical protein
LFPPPHLVRVGVADIRARFFSRRLERVAIRAELALKLEPLLAARAKERQQLSEGPGIKGTQKSAYLSRGETRDELVAIAGISHDTIAKSKRIVAEGRPERLC